MKSSVHAVLSDSPVLGVTIQNEGKTMYVINRLKTINEDTALFGSLFSYAKEHAEMKFWVEGESYLLAVPYSSGISIREMFADERYHLPYEMRLQVLCDILLAIYQQREIPLPVLLSLSHVENILLSDSMTISFQFALHEEYCHSGVKQAQLHENLHAIMQTILAPELRYRDNLHLRILAERCKKGLFSSIVELVYALQHTEVIVAKSPMEMWRKRLFAQLKRLPVKPLSIIGVAFILAFYIHSTFLNQPKVQYRDTTSIGTVQYVLTEHDPDTALTFQPLQDTTAQEAEPIVIPSNVDMEYQCYIVSPYDTVDSICAEFYPDKRFGASILSYNDLPEDMPLPVGSILRLPTTTAVVDYLSR